MNLNLNRRRALSAAVQAAAGASLVAALVGKATTAAADSDTAPDAQVTMFIIPDGLQGPDGKMHDAVIPSNIVVGVGVPTSLRIVNLDGGQHSITSDDLGVNIIAAAGTKDASGARVATVTTSTITVPTKGNYRWDCSLTCDGGAGHWAMSDGFGGDSQEGYMAGFIVAV